jgi:hypothetical protein
MHPLAMNVLLVLQCFHVAFLALHDWVPLGALNDVRAARAANPGAKLFVSTLVSTSFYAIGLAASLLYFHSGFPDWLFWWLWISYALLFAGELRAWWIPYFFYAEPARAARYQIMFGATHAFLRARNGIRPNTLHIILHLATLALLITLAVVT